MHDTISFSYLLTESDSSTDIASVVKDSTRNFSKNKEKEHKEYKRPLSKGR